MKHSIYTLLLSGIITTVSAQTTTSFLTLGEGNSTGDGTFIGVSSYSTQPCYTKSFSLEHHFYGYINSSINFFRGGSATGGFLTFNTNDNSERMRIDANGNVGIGTTNPQSPLHIKASTGYGSIRISPNSDDAESSMGFFSDAAGTANSTAWIIGNSPWGNTGKFIIGNQAAGGPMITALQNGSVGIGTTNPAYKLDVLGTIRAKEVLVNLDGGADFVFEKGYKLLPIEHVANYVQENKHLPDIPSANEMVKNGVSMGDMQVKLLQKVEELTLYVIELKKGINQQNIKINELSKQ